MPNLIGIKDVMKLTGRTRQGVYYMCKNGYFPSPVKICGRVLWDKHWVETYIRTGKNVRPSDDKLLAEVADDDDSDTSWTNDRDVVIALLRETLHARDDADLLGKTTRLLETVARLRNILNGKS